jgi:hypothetical protein
MLDRISITIILSTLLISCIKDNCGYNRGLEQAQKLVSNRIDVDIYEVRDYIEEENYFVFKLSPPSGSTGFSPIIEVKRKNCTAKLIDWI